MAYPYGATVRVLRGTLVTDRFDSESQTISWTTPTQVGPDYPRTPVAPTQLSDSPLHDQPDRQDETLTVMLPYGVAVKSSDRVQIADGPYVGTYAVDGRPSHWLNPFTGWKPGAEIRLKDITSGN